MEKELEIKVLNMDLEDLEKRVIALGAEKVSVEEQENLRINAKENPIDEELGYLRLRQTTFEDGSVENEFTFKAKDKGKTVRNYSEYTVQVDDKDTLLEILKIMGYDQIIPGYKHRVRYKYQGAKFDFDTWDKESYPTPYMEIEGESEEQIGELIKILEIPEENVSKKSIAELRKEWKKIENK
ncbi:class IV adenylate cyclase [Peptoniphilus sp. KCTC 25270]|uniref:class IV adenylate cyclase n=1 Tax=Peptoniphilus sp. KCTC 25270 TaxID=2897414 RepID=UPI001E550500|nr:class IV adenylate cyclase [Peptoniphilus sp. KCTC 25270]MCD1147223.1 class IV adenylate cyclase [Peptoniphilus sp. KCTC 25270]